MTEVTRRTFVAGAAAGAAFAAAPRLHAQGANESIVLAIMGANSRGSALAEGFAGLEGVEIAYVCDVDERAIKKGIEAATSHGGRAPKGLGDFRHALDDPAVDALVCAAPNHWHGPATLLACDAGKHVYVEKPACHVPAEGEAMIAAARKANRVVQVGMQRRSNPLYQQIVELIRGGAIGDLLLAKSWYYNDRPSIGRGQQTDVPAWLNYELWQGPAPETPYQDNVIHYNWHWFWNWGNGEIGNNGVHTIDVCRWALGVDFPNRVSVAGGRYRYDDDQQTPDTMTASFDCNGRTVEWEGVSWSRAVGERKQFGFELRGTAGSILADDEGFTVFDAGGQQSKRVDGASSDREHLENFLACVRNGGRPNADIEDGHRSALFCHLGNIAYRTGRSLAIDPATGHIKDDADAQAMWTCPYREGWMVEA
jgi:predicted dehydrogenase